MFINQIKEWDKGEQVVVFLNDGSVLDEKRKRICEIDCKHLSYFDGVSRTYEYETGTLDVRENDIVTIAEDGKVLKTHYTYGNEVDIFVTNHCNSNCIMCPLSETSRRKKNPDYMAWLKKYIEALPEDVAYLNITGGEPTLAREDFFEILTLLRSKFQNSGFQLLTNGRSIADGGLLKRLLDAGPSGMLFAIPVHSCVPAIHDGITQVNGSFLQTDRGIKNLLRMDQRVEIRIVLSKISIDTAVDTAFYISRNYPGVSTVNFVAMEMMGNAAVNRERIWIEYDRIFPKIQQAIDILINAGIDVKLYNFPLCVVKRGYWHIAAKSISAYKIQYQDSCESCCVKEICGGFFGSTKKLMNPKVYPVQRSGF